MLNSPAVVAEKQFQFEKDKAAFDSLSAGQKRTITFLAKSAYSFRQSLVNSSDAILKVADKASHFLFTRPWNAARPYLAKTWDEVAREFKIGAHANPDSKISRFWRQTKQKVGSAAKRTGASIEYYGSIGTYRTTQWILDPRWPSGKPLFGNEKINKAIGTGAGVIAFTGFSLLLSWIEVMARVWHARIAQSALSSHLPLSLNIARQGFLHGSLTVALTAAQAIAIPLIAATRWAIKSTRLAQGLAYQYNARLRKQPSATKQTTGWKPSTAFNVFVAEIVEITSPEFYKARIKYFQELHQKKKAEKSPPPTAEIAPATTLGDKDISKPFNDKAADPTPPAPATPENTPPVIPPPPAI